MRTIRTLTLTAATVAAMATAVPALAGGGGGGGGPCPAYAPQDVTEVVLLDNCFGPVSATAPAGTTLTIRNDGAQPHTYTAVDGTFDTGVVLPGDATTIELPATAGTLPVYCTLHADRDGAGMAGTVTLATGAGPSGLGTPALALAGGVLLGSGGLAALRRRGTASDAETVAS